MGFIEFIVGIVLVGDILLFMKYFKDYCWYERSLGVANLKSYVQQQVNETVPYAVIRGTVMAIGAPIKSAFSSWDKGVLQKIKVFELRTNQRKLVGFEINEVPFMITNGEHGVEVTEALSAAMLDWTMVYDSNVPSFLTLLGQLFGYFPTIKEGFRRIEEMLLEGSLVTAVGEIKLDAGNLRLQPSFAGPIFLTTGTKYEIIEKLQEEQFAANLGCLISAVVFIGIILRWTTGNGFREKRNYGVVVNKPEKKQKRKGNRSKKQRVLVPL